MQIDSGANMQTFGEGIESRNLHQSGAETHFCTKIVPKFVGESEVRNAGRHSFSVVIEGDNAGVKATGAGHILSFGCAIGSAHASNLCQTFIETQASRGLRFVSTCHNIHLHNIYNSYRSYISSARNYT